ncbi:MAG: tetratricopeptide repeat protein [Pirellulales bacterium]|nr:tetratricopeptide repeat protein [Pirellulales bacterium]
MMQRLIFPILLAAIGIVAVPVAPSEVVAQGPVPADAEQAMQEARAAYDAKDFEKARDLALKASETDPDNAEVHLLLGLARYQLGEVHDAIAAWKRTLQLAPEQPYAKKILAVLQGQVTTVDTRIKLIELLIQQKLYPPALNECTFLQVDKSMDDRQRAKVMTLQAELLVRIGEHSKADEALQKLLVLHPEHADPIQTTLLLGLAKLGNNAVSRSDGLALLKKVAVEHPDTPAAIWAQYELNAFDLRQGITPARVEAMANWVAANRDHEFANQGRRELLTAYLRLTVQSGKPAPQSNLSPTDEKALALAAELFQPDLPPGEADTLTNQLLKHLRTHYVDHEAYTAALKATDILLATSLPSSCRSLVLKAAGYAKIQRAIRWLNNEGRAGRLPPAAARGELPPVLSDVVKVYETIRSEYPADPLWGDQVELAKQVRAHATEVISLPEFQGLGGPDSWALDIALPVIKANADAASVASAVEVIQGIIHDRMQVQNPASRKLAVDLNVELLEAIAPSHPSWSAVIASYYAVAADYANLAFHEAIQAGHAAENAKLSEHQKKFLAILKNQLASHPAHASQAVVQLAEHVKLWVEHGHWAVAEEVYTAVADALPPQQRCQADLAVAQLWIQQTIREHQRLVAVGLTVPRQLDPRLAKALRRCYQLQVGFEPESSTLAEVRAAWDSIVGHYKALEYYDIAEAAIQVKADEAVEPADAYAAFQWVVLKDEQARRELAQFLNQYSAIQRITLSPAFQEVIAAWKKFISDRPASSLIPQAIERVFAIANLFEQQKAFGIAAGVYGEFAEFAGGVEVLSQAFPEKPSTAQRAAFAMGMALDAQAREVLAKAMTDRKSEDPPPSKLSDEFTQVINAYKKLVKAHPDSPLVGEAIGKVMEVALEYAKIDAWDVADAVYADLLDHAAAEPWGLAIRRPERLQFCRGLCQLGRAMPEHAKEVLRVMTEGSLRGQHGAAGPAMLAMGGAAGARAASSEYMPVPEIAQSVTGSVTAEPRVPQVPGADLAKPDTQLPADAPRGAGLRAARDMQLLAMIHQQESSRAAQVAELRDRFIMNQAVQQPQAQQTAEGQQAPSAPVLSDTELVRQDQAMQAAYDVFQTIRKDHPQTPTAEQARGEILVMVGHWRGLGQWERSATMASRFLADNPTDPELPKLRIEIARDHLAWASQPIERKLSKQEMLAEVAKRFDTARAELAKIISDFPKERDRKQDAQWEIANSYLSQARVVDVQSPTLARGQYVRATTELRGLATKYPTHPRIGEIPQMLWNIGAELDGRGYNEEALLVWNELTIHDPMHGLAQQAAMKIAETYHRKLKLPLRAAEAYQELNFAHGGNDEGLQNAIFQIGKELKDEKRWVEALHVLETFVDSFPRHPQAGQALTMAGQIHQTNEAWEDAIAAYRRVIAEFQDGQFVQEAKWAIAECTINLSHWDEASEAYRTYVAAYPQDGKVPEANRRIEVLKDLARYQGLVDEEGQRKAFDAQYQIATIVSSQLANPVKAIIEYRKVVDNWASSHLADDALYAVGTTYLQLGETEKAREALLKVAQKYTASPLADDALFMVGKSFEDEAEKLATVTRETTLERNKDVAQRRAYQMARDNLSRQQQLRSDRIADLKQAGKGKMAETEEASASANYAIFNDANVKLFADQAQKEVVALTAMQLADRQDKINAALRKAVEAYSTASKVAGADKADEALLQMATIYDQRLKDSQAAMQTWLEIVRQFSGTTVAEDASWSVAQYYQREGKYAEAIEAFQAFLRNYRRSPKAAEAQFAVAENYEQLGQWINAMDSYTNYMTNFPEGPLVKKAQEQINWIKTYRL